MVTQIHNSTHWCCLTRDDGVLEIRSLPTWNLHYFCKNFAMSPKVRKIAISYNLISSKHSVFFRHLSKMNASNTWRRFPKSPRFYCFCHVTCHMTSCHMISCLKISCFMISCDLHQVLSASEEHPSVGSEGIPAVKEICVVGMGWRRQRPHLLTLIDDDLFIYSAFPYNTPGYILYIRFGYIR